MTSTKTVTNIKVAGLGGQGVVRASDVLANAVFRAGWDLKKSELHGMSQRGGSVSSDVRFGEKVWSPMIPDAETDYLVIMSPDQIENNLPSLKPGGVLIQPSDVDAAKLPNTKSLNVALLGALSSHLSISESVWREALAEAFAPEQRAANEAAFQLGRQSVNQ
jgi:indolepyruvate ferredoxin oxidoreductase, beta subunit